MYVFWFIKTVEYIALSFPRRVLYKGLDRFQSRVYFFNYFGTNGVAVKRSLYFYEKGLSLLRKIYFSW